jgi:hypothetical protein
MAPSLYWFHPPPPSFAGCLLYLLHREEKEEEESSLIAIVALCSHSKGGALQRNLDLSIPKKELRSLSLKFHIYIFILSTYFHAAK